MSITLNGSSVGAPSKLLRNFELDAILSALFFIGVDQIASLNRLLGLGFEDAAQVPLVVVLFHLFFFIVFLLYSFLVSVEFSLSLLSLLLFGLKQVHHESSVELAKLLRALTSVDPDPNFEGMRDVDRVSDLDGEFD